MASNLDRWRNELATLIKKGEQLEIALMHLGNPDVLKMVFPKEIDRQAALKKMPNFHREYQVWYSEAHSVIKQLLPDRLGDFVRAYETPKGRRKLDVDTYRIEDALHGLEIKKGETVLVSAGHVLNLFQQQLSIVRAAERRFDSSLFDLKQLVQADLFDSELDAAQELANKNFHRAAGAVAGVVLERHLGQVCQNHKIAIAKKHPGISHLNDLLKNADVIDIPQWRAIQHLGDLRNLCDHDKQSEPTQAQISDLLAGVTKVTKTLF